MQNYKILNHIVLWNVFFAIICIPTAGKLIDVMGILLSISIYYFPFVYIYIVADMLTEVYSYAIARRVLWYCISAQLLAIAIFDQPREDSLRTRSLKNAKVSWIPGPQ